MANVAEKRTETETGIVARTDTGIVMIVTVALPAGQGVGTEQTGTLDGELCFLEFRLLEAPRLPRAIFDRGGHSRDPIALVACWASSITMSVVPSRVIFNRTQPVSSAP